MTDTSQLREEFGHLILATFGADTEFSQVSSFEQADASSLIFIQAGDQLNSKAAVVVTTQAIAEDIKGKYAGFIICVEDVRMAQALIKQAYHDYQGVDLEWPEIHPSAVIHDSATLGKRCRVGPNAVIGRNVTIGDDVVVRSNSVIEFDCTIDSGSTIHPNVTIGYASQIGKRVIVQPGCSIASEGYGFAKAKDNHYERVPQTGNVILEDDVFVASNCCIDRATYGSTIIRRGVKIDNLVHIAHNVEIGEDSLIIAQTGIAGSSTVGKRVIASGQSGILDHKTVADDAILVHRAGVIEDVPGPGMWGGMPAKPLREHTRRLKLDDYVLKRFAKLEDTISKLELKLEAQSNREPSK